MSQAGGIEQKQSTINGGGRQTKLSVSNGEGCGSRSHFDIISDSISQIIARSKNERFRSDAKMILKVGKIDRKVMRRRILKHCENNYDDAKNTDCRAKTGHIFAHSQNGANLST